MKNRQFNSFIACVSHMLKKIQQAKSKKMAQYGLKTTTALCMCEILNAPEGLTAGELATKCEIDKAQVSRCIAELAAKEYVYRNAQEGQHYRQKHLLTETGIKIAQDIVRATGEVKEVICRGISEEELDHFCHVLNIVDENLKNNPELL